MSSSKLSPVQQTAADVLQLVRSAGAKLAEHWPTLLALTFAGFTAKLATVKLAVLASGIAWAAGVFVHAFAPAALLAALLLMFRKMLPSRSWPSFTVVLVPFLLIYISTNHFDGYSVSPAVEPQVSMDVAAASVLAAAIVLRWLMPLWAAVNDQPWAAYVRMGLDICWMSLLALTIATHPLSRLIADLAEPVSWVFSTALMVIIVPVAWLAVGALATGTNPLETPDLVRRAGLPLTLAASLLIVVVQLIPLLLWQIERLILGARDPETFWLPLSGIFGAVNSAIGVLLLVCLVAAFVERSSGGQPGIGGQRGGAHDADGDGFGFGGRDEQDGHLIGV